MEIRSFLLILFVGSLASCSSAPRATKESSAAVEAGSLREAKTGQKIGLILGPGGAKTMAHLGVLREFERARIPIHGVVGLEWGALVGAAYAVQGKANDAEWRLLKLKKDIFRSRSLLPGKPPRADRSELQSFLKQTFGANRIEQSSVGFQCPAGEEKRETVSWKTSGPFVDALIACVPYPPLFEEEKGESASPLDVLFATSRLREQGADIVVLVNVLAQGEPLGVPGASWAEQLLWREIQRSLNTQGLSSGRGPDFVIGVHTRGYGPNQIEAARSLILFGRQSGELAVKRLSEKYGI